MSIKIITYYYTNNYGALLQSLCLKTFIENYVEEKIFYARYQPKKLMFSEIYRPLITKNLSKFSGVLIRNIKIRAWKKSLGLKKPIYKKNSENEASTLSIFGSDEIWNYQNAYHGYEQYFFGEDNFSNKISYAASFGRSKFDFLSTKQKDEIRYNLKNFKSISVRDINSAHIIKKIMDIEPIIVVDPTLLSTPSILNDENKIVVNKKTNYALVYGTVFSEEQRKIIKDYCKKRNYELYSIGYMNRWINKNYLSLDPTEFYQIMKNSKIVFTSMFHGIMFSVKLKRNFWFSIDPIRQNKINHFINELNLQNRELKTNIDLEKEIDYQNVYKILDKWILKSKNFLISSIKEYL